MTPGSNENSGEDMGRALRTYAFSGYLIGDLALMQAAGPLAFVPGGPPVFVEKIDLGEAWTRATGLPFVFAVWAGRAGRLTARASVDGTLGAPAFDGSLQLRKGEVDLYAVNLALRDISLDAKLDGRGLQFSGSTRAGDGRE